MSNTIHLTVAPPEELPVDCPDCGGAVFGFRGSSAGYFTGVREYYATYRAICSICQREGFPAYYQGDKLEWAKTEAIRQFLDRDSRPTLTVVDFGVDNEPLGQDPA